jgi:hypothetical protein
MQIKMANPFVLLFLIPVLMCLIAGIVQLHTDLGRGMVAWSVISAPVILCITFKIKRKVN